VSCNEDVNSINEELHNWNTKFPGSGDSFNTFSVTFIGTPSSGKTGPSAIGVLLRNNWRGILCPVSQEMRGVSFGWPSWRGDKKPHTCMTTALSKMNRMKRVIVNKKDKTRKETEREKRVLEIDESYGQYNLLDRVRVG
jgi:hypothetical protein